MAGFMAGFGTKLSELIEEDRKYYRDAAAKRRDYIQTYGTRAVVDRENKANAAKGVYNYLISNDISEEDARYVLNTSGVQGLAQLKATIDSRTDLTADERSKLVKKAKDYVDENPDEDINSVLKRAYGLYKSTDNPVKRERSMFASMLGLDSRMMEDEVLDDMYINGYSGRDIYRIMGSAEAQTGTALDLDLPTKPPSPTVLNNTAKFLESQFDTSIDSRISSVRQQMLKADPKSTDYTDLNDEVTKLENLKAKGLLALGEYAAAYDPALFDFARAQEEALPGSITRNSYLFEFLPAYQTHFEEAKDEDKLAAAGAGASGAEEPKGDGKVDEPPKKTTHKVTSEAEALELLQSGEVKVGDDIDINGTIRPVTSLPESSPKTTDLGDMSGAPGFRTARVDTTESVGLGDMTGAPSFRERDDVSVAMTEELQEAADAVKDTLPEDLQAEFDSFINEEGGALAFNSILSDEPLPEDVQAELEKFESEEVPSVMDYIKNFRGVKSGLTLAEKFANPLFFLDPQYYVGTVEPGLTLGAAQEKTVTRAFDTEERQVLEDYIRAAQRRGYKPTSEDLKEIKNVLNRATDTPAYKQLQEIIAERTGISLEETEAEIEKLIKEDPQSIASAMLYGKAQDTESGAGTFTGEPTIGEAPDIQTMARSGTLGDTRTDADPTLPRSMVAEQMTTRGKKARPSGLMSPPREFAPKLGQAEFGDLIDRVHGSSKAAEAFNDKVSSGKVTAADVTRLIKATRKLPNTKSKDTLLDSLFDLRDALNKR